MAEERPATPSAHEQSRAMAELRQLLGFHISLANTAVKAHFQKQSEGLGLTQKQIAILWLLDGCPGIIQVDLAKMLGVKRATMWATIGTLCARALLERRASGGEDARHVALTLTPEGRAVLRRAKLATARHEAWVKEVFSSDEQRTLAALMSRLYHRPG